MLSDMEKCSGYGTLLGMKINGKLGINIGDLGHVFQCYNPVETSPNG